MAEEFGIAAEELEIFDDENVKDLIELRPWMKDKTFIFLNKREETEKTIDELIAQKICALDLETTGLNTRLDKNGKPLIKIVGICLGYSADKAAYIPVSHYKYDHNVPYDFALKMLKKLCNNCPKIIFHNFKYDGEVLKNSGIILEDETIIEDTYLLAAIEDPSRKEKGLKYLSETLLERPMIEISDLSVKNAKKKIVAFDLVSPKKALYYGGSDGMNTFALWEFLKKRMDDQGPGSKSWTIYNKIEKKALFAVMEMERNRVKIDKKYYEEIKREIQKRTIEVEKEIYRLVGHQFDLNSPKQLGIVLFDELKVKYPLKIKNANGTYKTDEETLDLIKGQSPVSDLILQNRAYVKTLSTYIENFLANADEDDEVKFQLNQAQADTGRFSASGGKGLYQDGYSGVNCQNISNYDPDDPTSFNLRKGIIARPGYKLVALDYGGEELRIAANFSRDPKWIHEFNHGTADMHTMTGQLVYGRKEITKLERKNCKTLNFHILYGGGAHGFAVRSGLPLAKAKHIVHNYFTGYKGIANWISSEKKAARKREFSLTAFGRRRPLQMFYNSPDEEVQAKGDRCAVNSAIQGCLQKHERCLTTEGYISIEKIIELKSKNIYMRVWTGTSWEEFDVVDRGEAQLAVLELENGMKIDTDTRHEVLTVGRDGYEFKHFKNLDKNTPVCVSIPREMEFGRYPDNSICEKRSVWNNQTFSIVNNEQWDFIGYLLGYVIGDGWVRNKTKENRYSITICFGKKELKTTYFYIKEKLEKLGINITNYRKSTGSKGESYTADINSKFLVELFLKLGYKCVTARYKRVPEIIFSSPLSMRKSFLKGYFDSDGSKPDRNKRVFHTPNKKLLQDVQLIAWTLGCGSKIYKTCDNNYILSWMNFWEINKALNIKTRNQKNRANSQSVYLPDFLREEITKKLKDAGCNNRLISKENWNKDRAYLSKINTGKKVVLPGVISLLKDYNCELPTIYYHFNVKSKKIIDKKESTYTLSVHSPLHRFDSAGIISKNTGADVLKLALSRVSKWIHDNNYENDVKMLMPVHDEIVFEIKEDKLDFFIPQLLDLMKLRDLIDKLGWVVPFDLDVEYGDTWDVDHDWKKEKEKEKSMLNGEPEKSPPVVSSPTVEKPVEENKPPIDKPPIDKMADSNVIGTQANPTNVYNFAYTIKEELSLNKDNIKQSKDTLKNVDQSEEKRDLPNINIEDRISDDFLIYTMSKFDIVVSEQFVTMIKVLTMFGDQSFIGPKKIIKLVAPDGEVLYTGTKKVSIDAFLALCLWLNI